MFVQSINGLNPNILKGYVAAPPPLPPCFSRTANEMNGLRYLEKERFIWRKEDPDVYGKDFDYARFADINQLMPLDRKALVSKYENKRNRYVEMAGAFTHEGGSSKLIINNKKLQEYEAKHVSKTENQWELVAKDIQNGDVSLMDKHLVKSGKLLEDIKEIAKLAQNEKLSDADRLALQTEMGRLQHELNVASVTLQLARGDKFHGKQDALVSAEIAIRAEWGEYKDTDGYKMLVRAQDRLAKGEEWDVGEVLNTIMKPNPDYVETEDKIPFDNGPRGLGVAKDKNPQYIKAGEEWAVADDKSVPTVGEIVKGKGRSVLDVESAIVTTLEIEETMEDIKKEQANLSAVADEVRSVNSNPNANKEDLIKIDDLVFKTYGRVSEFLQSMFRSPSQVTEGKEIQMCGCPVNRDRMPDERHVGDTDTPADIGTPEPPEPASPARAPRWGDADFVMRI